MKPASLILKSLSFLVLAVVTVAAMTYFGLIDLDSLRQALVHGQRWLFVAFALGLGAACINLWRYARLLELLQVLVPFRGVAAATSVSLFVGQWLPGSMAVSEMVRLGLMVGAEKLNAGAARQADTDPSGRARPDRPSGNKARIFVASFLDRACGLIVFMTVGSTACLAALGLEAQRGSGDLPAHELSLLGGLIIFGVCGTSALLSLPWLAKHPAVLRSLEAQSVRWLATSNRSGRLLGRFMGVLRKVTAPMADPAFTYRGFASALAISSMSSLSLVGLFWACAQAVGFPMTYLQVAAVFPFLAIAQLLPIGFGGIGGHQLVAVALFQAFSLDARGVATVSLVAGVVPLVLNAAVGVFFLHTSAGQVKAILQRAGTDVPLDSLTNTDAI